MRKDIIEFGIYKNKYWEDVTASDRNYVEWISKNHSNAKIQELAKYWLRKIHDFTSIDEAHMPYIDDGACITKNSEEYIVNKLGKDDARQLAYNILSLTEV